MPVATSQTPGIVDTWGGKCVDVIDWTGPTSYVNGTGEVIPSTAFGCFNNLLFVQPSMSVSGNYLADVQPSAVGAYTKWNIRFFLVSTALEVTNGTNLSAETFKLWGFGV